MDRVNSIDAAAPDQGPAECPNCGLLAWGEFGLAATADAALFNEQVAHHRQIRKGAHLYQAGEPLDSLHVIRSGFLVTTTVNNLGFEQVTRFLMPGDTSGMDGIANGIHQCNTVAIEDSSVCGIAFAQLEKLCAKVPALQRHFHRLLSQEINRDQSLLLLLGGMRGPERLAVFLLNLSAQYSASGHSATNFRLPMRYKDIASYLGLRLETVSRLFAQFSKDELIILENKHIYIKNAAGLKQLIGDYEKRRSPVPGDDF